MNPRVWWSSRKPFPCSSSLNRNTSLKREEEMRSIRYRKFTFESVTTLKCRVPLVLHQRSLHGTDKLRDVARFIVCYARAKAPLK